MKKFKSIPVKEFEKIKFLLKEKIFFNNKVWRWRPSASSIVLFAFSLLIIVNRFSKAGYHNKFKASIGEI